MPTLSSKDNPRLKHLKKLLDDRRYRSACGEYVIEGRRALDDNRHITSVFVCAGTPAPAVPAAPVYVVDQRIFAALAPTEQTQGVMAVAALRTGTSADIRPDGRYVLLDRIQDPGNMGTIIRTACAFGCSGCIMVPGNADPFAPKVVRAAASALDKIPIIPIASLAELAGVPLIAADAAGSPVAGFSWPAGFILAIGNEANGLSDELLRQASFRIAIPHQATMESLNAAVAAGILLYAASAAIPPP